MRDPKRIDELMSLLTELWKKHPDTRFNQLLDSLQYQYQDGNYVKRAFKKEKIMYLDEEVEAEYEVSYPDLFYVEDENFIKYLKQCLDK